jgi:hypothetical protein
MQQAVRLGVVFASALLIAGTANAATHPGTPPPSWEEGDPLDAARRAIALNDYRLVWQVWLGGASPLGITCQGPLPAPNDPGAASIVGKITVVSDVIGPDFDAVSRREAAQAAFGKVYNVAVVSAPDYPYPDVCRPARPGDPSLGPYRRRWATPPAGPPLRVRTLGDAARVGSVRNVRALLASGAAVDEPDPFGVTPLGWALIRGHDDVAIELLQAGAAPHEGQSPQIGRRRIPALLYAVAFARNDLLERMWTPETTSAVQQRLDLYADAAVFMGNTTAFAKLLALQKEPVSPTKWRSWFEIALQHQDGRMAEVVLKEGAGALDPASILDAAIAAGDLHYVELALRRGADPEGDPSNGGPALYAIASNLGAANAPQVAGRLIRSGASIDRANIGNETPLQVLLRRGRHLPSPRTWLEPTFPAITPEGRTALLGVLLDAGADVNRPDPVGRPTVIQYLHIYEASLKPRDFEPQWLPLLVGAGMDLNARYLGRTALQYAQAAGDDKLAEALAALGAR